MPWDDQSWRDGYDAWKLASPYDDEPGYEYCEHEDHQLDILEGVCRCRCGHVWAATDQQLDAELAHLAALEDAERRARRWRWIVISWEHVSAIFRRRPRVPPTMFKLDDDIPF
jgi:hypothetical protein